MLEQINLNMDLMSHTLPWHMVDLPPDTQYGALASKLRRLALGPHPDKNFGAQVLCQMAGFSVQ
eukprot:3420784-Prorocentrum_lima.AAC.1